MFMIFLFIGVNMGYMENSYSNSNNGGSVNSQDSLWQMKMASAASNANSVSNDHPPRITDQVNHYGKGSQNKIYFMEILFFYFK